MWSQAFMSGMSRLDWWSGSEHAITYGRALLRATKSSSSANMTAIWGAMLSPQFGFISTSPEFR